MTPASSPTPQCLLKLPQSNSTAYGAANTAPAAASANTAPTPSNDVIKDYGNKRTSAFCRILEIHLISLSEYIVSSFMTKSKIQEILPYANYEDNHHTARVYSEKFSIKAFRGTRLSTWIRLGQKERIVSR